MYKQEGEEKLNIFSKKRSKEVAKASFLVQKRSATEENQLFS